MCKGRGILHTRDNNVSPRGRVCVLLRPVIFTDVAFRGVVSEALKLYVLFLSPTGFKMLIC